MFRRILIGSGLLFILFSSFITVNIAFAAITSNNASDDIAAMQKTCAVIHIQLNEAKHTSTCLKSRSGLAISRTSSSAAPNIGTANCNASKLSAIVDYGIDTSNSGSICFSGTGYTGTHITNVNIVTNESGYTMWIRYYGYNGGGGAYCTIGGYPVLQQAVFGYGSNPTNVLITQVDVGDGANGGTCPS